MQSLLMQKLKKMKATEIMPKFPETFGPYFEDMKSLFLY